MATYPVSLVILNGKSAENEAVRNAVKVLRDEGYTLHIRVTWEKEDTPRYVDEALALGVDTVIAGGGDGTINAIATCLAKLDPGKRPALGILPLGTANDFATSAGIPLDAEPALRLAIVASAIDVDLIQVNHDAFFINMATGGFGTRITTETPEKMKSVLGSLSYFIHGLISTDTLKPDRCEIHGDGFNWQGDALVIGIGNGRQAGGGQQLCPDALINDGLLDLRIFTGEELLPALMTQLTDVSEFYDVTEARSAWFSVTAPNEITFNLDGEPLSGREFHLEVHPHALACRLPPNCPLIK
ncbi:lipid kinase YegS [Citrobacter sp. JGM124]|uniref:lipid kinase YegS n=1 Tax=Citrobacter sp. JGM124 TaxID=2799789 RepID=UPI001BADB1A9|nr:lipid kinase YegS [Citrobacter sp. JGM124]MBS0847938.1 lipid kinase YegS [Citrobacter sp. JGM124]